MHITIDGKVVTVFEGMTILEAARSVGIDIPTLCHHGGVEPYAGCRVCMVEIRRSDWTADYSKLVTACNYEVENGLIVDTRSQQVTDSRRDVLALLLSRSPKAVAIQEMAAEYGILASPYLEREEGDNCILCGLCIRVCEAIGASAIGTTGRGFDKLVEMPFGDPEACIGCLACAETCPTDAIPYQQDDTTRTIWGRTFQRTHCKECGAPMLTPEHISHFAERSGLTEEYFDTCDACRKRQTAEAFIKVIG